MFTPEIIPDGHRGILAARQIILGAVIAGLLLAQQVAAAKHDSWIEVRSPHFVVVSNAGEKQARKTSVQFEQIRALFQSSLAVASGHPTPVITILAAKDEKSLSELLPEYWTKGHVHPSGWFAYRMEQFYIALNLDAQGENPYETVYHEYYHSLTMPYFPNLPAWLAEGLADFYGNSGIKGNVATMGDASAGLIDQLRQNKLIPLDVLFKVDHSSPYYNEQNKTSLFYAESWALTHYLMIGDKQSHRQMLVDYASALAHGASSDAAAAQAFGDINVLQKALANYVNKNSFNYFQMKAPDEPPPSDLSVRTLSDAEADAYRAGLFAVRGQTQVAETMLAATVQADPKLALGYQNLALTQFFAGKRAEALASADKAVSLDPDNALTRYLRAFLSVHGGGNAEDHQIEGDLRHSIALNPDFAPPCGLLAWYLATRNRDLPEALKLGEKAMALEPANTAYQLDYAQVLVQMRRLEDAQQLATRARDTASDPQQRASSERFLNYLEQVRQTQASWPPPSDRRTAAADSNREGSQPNGTRLARPSAPKQTVMTQMKGNVKDVACDNHEMRITLAVRDVDFDLHVRDYSRVNFDAGAPFENGKLDPCTQLKGRDATVSFVLVENKPYDGEIQSLEIEK